MIRERSSMLLYRKRIADFVQETEEKCRENHWGDEKSILRFRLELEEVLLRLMEDHGSGAECEVTSSRLFGTLTYTFKVKGEQIDSAEKDEEVDEDGLSSDVLAHLNSNPVYSYSLGKNRISVSMKIK